MEGESSTAKHRRYSRRRETETEEPRDGFPRVLWLEERNRDGERERGRESEGGRETERESMRAKTESERMRERRRESEGGRERGREREHESLA